MESRIEESIKRKNKGYNCAQAVACTYCDLVNLDEKTMFMLTEGLGGGLGNMEGTCGAVVGACILAGLLNSNGDTKNPTTKASTSKLSREIMQKFKERNQTTICKELKGVRTGVVLRSCPDCVRDAAEFIEDIINA